MKLFIDPSIAGISGDMLLGALIDLGADPNFLFKFNNIPRDLLKGADLNIDIKKVIVNEFSATQVEVNIKSDAKFTANELLEHTQKVAKYLGLSEKAMNFATKALTLLIKAEREIHSISEDKDLELDETGSVDTIVDIIGSSYYIIDYFKVDEVNSLPVSVGGGRIVFSHGDISVPVPAVLKIAELRGIPIRGGPVDTEIATPTGMAILGAFVTKFMTYLPGNILVRKIGYGAGQKRFPTVPNLLRVILYEDFTATDPLLKAQYVIFETNVDDVTPEILGHFLDKVIREKIAIDGYITPVLMKKGRPGHLLTFLLTEDKVSLLMDLVIKELGSLGGRFYYVNKLEMPREVKEITVSINNENIKVPIKIGYSSDGKIATYKAEYEALKELSNKYNIPLKKLKQIIEGEVYTNLREGFK